MPIYVQDDGKYFGQSMAILKMLAFEHGYMPETPMQTYEESWFYATVVDCLENKPDRYALMQDEPAAEMVTSCIEIHEKFIKKCDAHWADGRAHVAGDKMTHADFAMLGCITSMYDNANGKHTAIKEATQVMLTECTNVARVMAPMRELCAETIANMPASSL